MRTTGSTVSDALAVAGGRNRLAAGTVTVSIHRSRLSKGAVHHGTRFQPTGVALVAIISGDGHHAFTVSSGRYTPIGTNRASVGARSWRETVRCKVAIASRAIFGIIFVLPAAVAIVLKWKVL